MLLQICKAKVENAVVTDTNLSYQGSLAVDLDILDRAGVLPYENALVVNFNTGERFETYIIAAERGSGRIGLEGGTARLGQVGDRIGFLCYAWVDPQEAEGLKPRIVTLKEGNKL
jgi:aspartate 1-decarboxylase